MRKTHVRKSRALGLAYNKHIIISWFKFVSDYTSNANLEINYYLKFSTVIGIFRFVHIFGVQIIATITTTIEDNKQPIN